MTKMTTTEYIEHELRRLRVASTGGCSGLDVVDEDDGLVTLADSESVTLPADAVLAALRALPDDCGVTDEDVRLEGSRDRAAWVAVWDALNSVTP